MNPRGFGLIGTISKDEIVYEAGRTFHQLGGVLYQAAVLCGLGQQVRLFANLARGLAPDVEAVISSWPALDRRGMRDVPGPGNLVRLSYPEKGERREILESAVPPLEAQRILDVLPRLGFLIMVINSGFDMELGSWRRVAAAAQCPIWLDIHSLSLVRVLGEHRGFRPIPEWTEWARDATYLQANRQEVSCMLGRPDKEADDEDIGRVGRRALEMGLRAVFITLGGEGALVITPEETRMITPGAAGEVKDTTGCGDVFCAAAATKLVEGAEAVEAAEYGVMLAGMAARTSGVKGAHELALNIRIKSKGS